MNHCWKIALLSLLVSACAQTGLAPQATLDRIDQELKEAAASSAKARKNEALNRAMLPPLQIEAPTQPVPEPRFDLAVSNAAASQVFAALAAGSKYSMLVPPEVSGTLTLNLKRVTVREALEAIRELYGYEFSIRGTRILIQPNTMQTRMFQINYLASRRVGQTDVRVTSSSPSVVTPGGTSGTSGNSAGSTQPAPATQSGGASQRSTDSSHILTQSDSDFWKELKQALAAIVGTQDGRAVIINPISGVVLIKAMPSEMRSIENYLKATQLIVERQVMLEAKILEVELSDGFQTGINWAKFGGGDNRWGIGVLNPGTTLGATGNLSSFSGGTSGTQTTADPTKPFSMVASTLGKGFFGLAFQAKDFAAMLSFLETQGEVHVLSSPRVATINNQKAVLKVGTDDFFVTNVSTTVTSSGTGAPTVTPSITLQPFFSGVALDVMPQIDEDNNIILHIHPSVSVVTEKTKQVDLGSMGNFSLPLASSSVSETDSVVRVQDGNIVAIGGLMSQEQRNDRSGLPGISRAPGIGLLFGQKAASMRKRELVILLKPTVIQGENAWRQDLMDTQIRVQSFDPRRKAEEAR